MDDVESLEDAYDVDEMVEKAFDGERVFMSADKADDVSCSTTFQVCCTLSDLRTSSCVAEASMVSMVRS